MNLKQHQPIHPGEFIKRVYLEPFDLGSNEVAAKLGVNASTFNRLLNSKSDVSPRMALKLSKVIGRSAESWLLMQDNFNLHKVGPLVDLDGLEPIAFAT